MNSLKLLSNLPIEELTPETDYLGILSKGDLIKQFLTGHKENVDKIKMFALYGDWGSGKSTVMKYLKTSLEKDKTFNTFFFEAWEYEKDENLALSLLEFLKNETKDFDEEYYGSFYEKAKRVIKGLAKSVSVEVGIPKVGSINIEPGKFIEEFEKTEQDSFYTALKELKKEFETFEKHLSKGKEEYNIVFIDDLDRCEPKHVLDLLSSIKLFFTYGKKTIFFCGIDKKAVEQAVRTQYNDIVKSEEYMEKIFDISFSMPKTNSLEKLVSQYFDNTIYEGEIANGRQINLIILDFLEKLEFTNPRKLKKALNKFSLLRYFTTITNNESNILDIDLGDGKPYSLFDTLIALYLIILHEFYIDDFNDFLNFDKKKNIYIQKYSGSAGNEGTLISLCDDNLSETLLSSIGIKPSTDDLLKFHICICPNNIEGINANALYDNSSYSINVSEKKIDFLFYKYISSQKFSRWLNTMGSNFVFSSVKKLINDLL